MCYYFSMQPQESHLPENIQLYPTGNIERDTGIARDTLRVWERRYGFPFPARNAKGERVYPETQLRRLQRIRRLLDRGVRPGKLLPLSEEALDGLEASLQPAATLPLEKGIREILDAIGSIDVWQVESLLRRQYEKQGMQAFVLRKMYDARASCRPVSLNATPWKKPPLPSGATGETHKPRKETAQ